MIENRYVRNGTQAFASLARLKKVKKREFVSLPGDPSEAVFLIKAGRIKITSSTRMGREVTLTILQAGELCGEVEALDEAPRETAAEALEDGILGIIPREDFARHLRTHPDLAFDLTRLLGARLRALQGRVQDPVFRDVPERLAHLLPDMAPAETGSAASDRPVRGPLTHQEMANLVGCARETVTTILGQCREEGLIRTDSRPITLVDREGLVRRTA